MIGTVKPPVERAVSHPPVVSELQCFILSHCVATPDVLILYIYIIHVYIATPDLYLCICIYSYTRCVSLYIYIYIYIYIATPDLYLCMYSAQYEESRMGGFSIFRHFLSHDTWYGDNKHTNMIPKDY